MKHTVTSLLLLSAGAAFAATPAEKEIKELLQASGCLSCHAAAEKLVGPSFQAIAAKYAGQADAVDALSQSVRNGSRGKWGRIPMPPHPSMNAADIKTLAQWIMATH